MSTVAIAPLDVQDELHRGVQEWARDQDGVLSHLVSQATKAIDVLESEPFDSTRKLHAMRLLVAFTSSRRWDKSSACQPSRQPRWDY